MYIIEKFLSNKIPPVEFVNRFDSLWGIDISLEERNKKEILENLNSKDLVKLPEYTDLVDFIWDLYEPIFYNDPSSISEKILRKELEVIFVKLKKLIDD